MASQMFVGTTKSTVQKYREQVEELKKENAKLKEANDTFTLGAKRTIESNCKLYKENQELKEEIDTKQTVINLTQRQADDEHVRFLDERSKGADRLWSISQELDIEYSGVDTDIIAKIVELKEENDGSKVPQLKEKIEQLEDQIEQGVYIEEAYYTKFCGNDYEGGIEEMSEKIEELSGDIEEMTVKIEELIEEKDSK